MGKVADAGRHWEKARDAADAAGKGNDRKRQMKAQEDLAQAFTAFQEALEQSPSLDDADDASYRDRLAREGTGIEPDLTRVVETTTELAGSIKLNPSSGSAKGSI
jgi:hypothetical protein